MVQKKKEIDFKALFDLLFSPEGHFPISSLYQLSDMPPRAMAEFEERWEQADTFRRQKLSRHMADIIEENFVVDYAPFAPLFLADPAENTRLAGLDLLWDSTDTKLIEPIIKMMRHDKNALVRAAAAATLGHYVLMSQWGELGSEIEAPIVTALLEKIDDPNLDPAMHRALLEALAASSSPRVPDLIEKGYDDIDEGMNQAAVFAMGRSADPRWVPIVASELDSDDPDMRAEAARAAAGISSSEFVEKLVELARSDEEPEVQIAAVFALGQIGNEQASRTLNELSEDEAYYDLHEAIDEALEDMMVLGMDLDLTLLDWEGEENLDDGEDED